MKPHQLLTTAFAAALVCVPVQSAFAQMPRGQQPTSPSMGEPSGPRSLSDPLAHPDVTNDSTRMRNDDRRFAKEAALGGMTEVEMGKLASQNASSDAVKQFAQRMIADHTKANDELKEVASKSSIAIPDALDSKHQARVDKLAKLTGADFDKAYIKDQVKDHEQDVREFQREADNGTDPNLKGFASKTLPTLQQHLDAVKQLEK